MKQLLNDAILDYHSLRASQDFSRRTLKNEESVLRKLMTVCGNIFVENISERHVIRYFEQAGKTRSPRSLQIDHTVLNGFFEWARQTRRMAMDSNPMVGRRRPKFVTKERARLHVSQFDHLLTVAGTKDPRDRALVAVLLYTLARDQEVADIRVGDVDLTSGYIELRIPKSHQEDRMPICAELDAELRVWLAHYAAACGPLHHSDYLLPGRRSVGSERDAGGRILSHSLSYAKDEKISRTGRVVTGLLEDIGFPLVDGAGRSTREGSHTLRRSGARALFDQLASGGYDNSLRIVQSMLHHSSVSITENYLGITADRRSRDEILRGKVMYETRSENVVRMTV